MSLVAAAARRMEEFRVSHVHEPAFLVLDPWTYRAICDEVDGGAVTRTRCSRRGLTELLGLRVVVLPWASETLAVISYPNGALAEAIMRDAEKVETP